MGSVHVALTLILPKKPWGLLRGAEKTPKNLLATPQGHKTWGQKGASGSQHVGPLPSL